MKQITYICPLCNNRVTTLVPCSSVRCFKCKIPLYPTFMVETPTEPKKSRRNGSKSQIQRENRTSNS